MRKLGPGSPTGSWGARTTNRHHLLHTHPDSRAAVSRAHRQNRCSIAGLFPEGKAHGLVAVGRFFLVNWHLCCPGTADLAWTSPGSSCPILSLPGYPGTPCPGLGVLSSVPWPHAPNARAPSLQDSTSQRTIQSEDLGAPGHLLSTSSVTWTNSCTSLAPLPHLPIERRIYILLLGLTTTEGCS